ncbi:Hypothetical protein UVM_LOCUS224, partial [uncultured virus]
VFSVRTICLNVPVTVVSVVAVVENSGSVQKTATTRPDLETCIVPTLAHPAVGENPNRNVRTDQCSRASDGCPEMLCDCYDRADPTRCYAATIAEPLCPRGFILCPAAGLCPFGCCCAATATATAAFH